MSELKEKAFKIQRNTGWTNLLVSLQDAEIAVEQEREACAALAECQADNYDHGTGRLIAAAIRNRVATEQDETTAQPRRDAAERANRAEEALITLSEVNNKLEIELITVAAESDDCQVRYTDAHRILDEAGIAREDNPPVMGVGEWSVARRIRAVIEENAKLRGSRRVPELDNHHNALCCGYCNGPLKDELERLTEENERLKQRLSEIEESGVREVDYFKSRYERDRLTEENEQTKVRAEDLYRLSRHLYAENERLKAEQDAHCRNSESLCRDSGRCRCICPRCMDAKREAGEKQHRELHPEQAAPIADADIQVGPGPDNYGEGWFDDEQAAHPDLTGLPEDYVYCPECANAPCPLHYRDDEEQAAHPDLDAMLQSACITCVATSDRSGRPDYYVKVAFKELEDAQKLFGVLHDKRRP